MTTFAITASLGLLAPVCALAAALAFGTSASPVPLASVSEPFRTMDYGGLPAALTFKARDGASLAYRAYGGHDDRVAVLVHGSSGSGISMHAVARALAEGSTVYALDIRGHGASGRRGDIDYVGQLDDDLADFVSVVRARHPRATMTLMGFSSGGGFALRFAAGAAGPLFDNYLLVSPALYYTAPTARPNVGGWVAVHVPRIIALSILAKLGIHWFDGLPVVAFAVEPGMEKILTTSYSARLASNFGSHQDYRGDIRGTQRPLAVLIGGADELLFPDEFAPLFQAVRPDVSVTSIPGIGHAGMITAPAALEAIKLAAERLGLQTMSPD